MARLTSGFWVQAYLARLSAAAIPAYVQRRGDGTAGAVVVKLATLDGQAQAFQRTLGVDGSRRWTVFSEGGEAEVDAAIARQHRVDPDLWVIEVEDRAGRHLLAEEGLSE